jgi:hypothetical protein
MSTECINGFYMNLRIKSDYVSNQHEASLCVMETSRVLCMVRSLF